MEKPQWPATTLTLLARSESATGIYTYIFKPAEPVAFIAGQYGHVRAISLPETTRRTRELSFASSPANADIEFAVDARSGSDYQEALKTLPIGGTVELFKIKGHMTWPSEKTEVVMIAGGIGITPFRSMLLDAKQQMLPVSTTLIHASSDAFLYADELETLAGEYERTNRAGLEGALARAVAAHSDAHYYIAGSPGFVQGAAAQLRERGIATIESDEFKGIPD